MRHRNRSITRLLCGAAALSLWAGLAQAAEEPRAFAIEPQPLSTALMAFGAQSGHPVMAPTDLTGARMSPGVTQSAEPEEALAQLLAGTGLTFRRTGGAFAIVQGGSEGPQSAGAGGDVDALIVTAQKREENIQDVPIAISAFSQKQLEAQKIEGGFDLLKAIPNVTFSKNNFTGYNFSIRGVGTKAISATTDPGVAVSFNNTALIQNRLFEQEYFDVERVEVLRGPQGTLYGRNATSGVINVISAKPDLNDFDGWLKGEVGNYHTKRVSTMINIPIIEDVLAIRLAGALTDRQGYDYNSVTGNAVNGRDLWSGRVTVGFEATERLRGNLIWERFNEDDNRSRTGKQLCHRDDGPQYVGAAEVLDGTLAPDYVRRALFGQGCKPGSLYNDDAFGTPNGLSYNFVLGVLALQPGSEFLGTGIGAFPGSENYETIIRSQDPYGGMMQSRDLREIASIRDPKYRAKADLLELNIDFDLTPNLTISSQTAYNKDSTYSFQDYNRFNTVPIFTDTSILLDRPGADVADQGGPSRYRNLAPGGIFCDPQIGCSNTIAGFDIASADGEQFSQELRFQSSYDGPVNFSLGANYTKFETLVDYYVMFNLLTAIAEIGPFNNTVGGVYDPSVCAFSSFMRGFFGPNPGPVSQEDPKSACIYIDPNPVESINGEGHNYFRSKNPYDLESWAAFGEMYLNITDDLKLTAGLRYTDDSKHFTPVPSQLLLGPSLFGGGAVAKGYPEKPAINQSWREWTGRLVLDWKPDLDFTDQTLVYASYSRGYKGGGANPPRPGFAGPEDLQGFLEAGLLTESSLQIVQNLGFMPILKLTAVEYGDTFDPEFVNAYEIGAKNTLLGGALQLNITGFYYDYNDYQVSQIRDRTAVNENFDAATWGLEFETMFSPSPNFQLIANLGYLDTEIADGETSIDIMNRTQGDPDYTLVKPWMQLPSNCVVPTPVAESWVAMTDNLEGFWQMCGGLGGLFGRFGGGRVVDPATGDPYDEANYPELNGGAGILADLGGNELPNAPHWTANLGAQYGRDILGGGWRATVRGDVYWQSQSWHRVYNSDPYDKLRGWWNANLSLWIERPDDGLKIELYVKNLLDDTPITDAFLNSDDTGLTTNVFVLDPRLIGLSIRKAF